MSSAAVTYAEQLVDRGYGLPLWHPEPTKFGEVHIGDVGFVREGCFYRLFNAMHPSTHPLNSRGVPEGFIMLSVDEEEFLHTDDECLPPGPVCTTRMTYRKAEGGLSVADKAQASYTFSCNDTCGAVAIFGDYGKQQQILSCIEFYQYILRHHASWHAFATSKGHILSPSSIILVSGWLKTREWALATFASHGRAHEISFSASAGSYASANFDIASTRNVHMSVEQRAGPSQRARYASAEAGEETLPCDQCLFLRYYKMKTRILGRSKVLVQADCKDMQGSSDKYLPPPSTRTSSSSNDTEILSRFFNNLLRQSSSGSSVLTTEVPIQVEEHASGSPPIASSMDVEEVPSSSPDNEFADPVDCLLDFILEYSTAQHAVASYDDLCGSGRNVSSQGDTINPAFRSDLALDLRRHPRKIIVDESGGGRMTHEIDFSKIAARNSEWRNTDLDTLA